MASDDIATMFAVSQLLGSLWALTPAALAALASVVRTVREDWILQCDLDSYAGCASLPLSRPEHLAGRPVRKLSQAQYREHGSNHSVTRRKN